MANNCKITSIIAHIDHGKTTLIDSLIASEGHFSKNLIGELRYLDNRKDEEERGITLKLTPIKLKNNHIFIDTPGHVDFESLIFSSAILTDNHIIIIDVNEGITPRVSSLIKFINRNRTILVLNKLDKCLNFESLDLTLKQINGLIGEEIFEWAKNNVIISSAYLGAGICYEKFIASKKNTISAAFKTFKLLDQKIEANDVKDIANKYNINFPNRRNVFSTLTPLQDCIYSCIDTIYKKEDDLINFEDNIFENKFYKIRCQTTPNFLGISVYGILKDKNNYSKGNVLFVTKMLFGTIKKGDSVICTNDEIYKTVVVEHIYEYYVDRLNEVESVSNSTIVYLQGDFLKNFVISSEEVDFQLKMQMTPFFCSKIVLKDQNRLTDIKSTIKTISYTEQNLKVKLNKFGELEFKCNGNIQFEKICYDLRNAGYDFCVNEPKLQFKEYSSMYNKHVFRSDNNWFEILVGPRSYLLEHPDFINIEDGRDMIVDDIKGNVYYIESETQSHIISSVLDIFTDCGPLIKEQIINTFLYIKIIEEDGKSLFSTLKKEFTTAYISTQPNICSLYYKLKLSLLDEYVGILFQILQKYDYIIESDDYNIETSFMVLECKIPHYNYNAMVNEIRTKTKGSTYLEVLGEEYDTQRDFRHMIDVIKKEKGMYYGEKIVEDPEKQRTLRK